MKKLLIALGIAAGIVVLLAVGFVIYIFNLVTVF